MIFVHLDCMPTEVRAECAKCGKCAASPVLESDGGPKTRQTAAKRRALAELTALCEERLPWGVAPHHQERVIPRGCSLYAEGQDGKLWELSVNARGLLETVLGGCHPKATVLVVPDAKKHAAAAVEFAAWLVERGYLSAQATKPGRAKQRAKR